jgi:ribosome-interacting GTPase 1
MILDASKGDVQKALLEEELETMGIRLNKSPPNISYHFVIVLLTVFLTKLLLK